MPEGAYYFLRVPTGVRVWVRYQRVPTGAYCCLRVPTGVCGCLLVPEADYWCLRVPTGV